MADLITKTYLDKAGLELYDELIKGYVDSGDQKSLQDAKDYADGLSDNYDAAGTAETKVNALANGAVAANTAAIEKLNGDAETTGSVAKAVADLESKLTPTISAAKKAGDDAQSDVDALETLVGSIPATAEAKTVVAYAKELADKAQSDATYDDTEVRGLISDNADAIDELESAVETLTGEGEGSVKKTVDDAINKFATDVTNDGVVNSYKELIDYVAAHGPEAAIMAANIEANTTAIGAEKTRAEGVESGLDTRLTTAEGKVSALETLVGTGYGEGKTVKAFIEDAVGAEQTRAEGAEGDLSDRLDAVEEMLGDGEDSVASQIATAKAEAIAAAATDATQKADDAEKNAKDYADSLAPNYATAAQGAKADTAVQKIETGVTNGTIKADGTEVGVAGLASAAYQPTTAFDAAGTASGLVTALSEGAVATNAAAISVLEGKVDSLEAVKYIPIPTATIQGLFSKD